MSTRIGHRSRWVQAIFATPGGHLPATEKVPEIAPPSPDFRFGGLPVAEEPPASISRAAFLRGTRKNTALEPGTIMDDRYSAVDS